METHEPGVQNRYPATRENRLRYLLYLPRRFNDLSGQRWPVLCFLHGAGEAATNRETAQPIEILLNHSSPPWHCEINSPLIHDFIVLSPQLPTRGPWAARDFEDIEKIMQRIYAEFRGDPDRSFLTGFSYGGRGVFDAVLWAEQNPAKDQSQRVRWAALWPVDDAAAQSRAACSVQRVWLHFGTWNPGPQLQTAGNLKLADAGVFRKGQAAQDRLYTDYRSVEYGHNATCVASYADWRVYEWLLTR